MCTLWFLADSLAAQQPAISTLEPPMPPGFRGIEPPASGADPAPRGQMLPLPNPTPSAYVPTWNVLYADNFEGDFVTGKADPPWSVDVAALIQAENQNSYLSLHDSDTSLLLKPGLTAEMAVSMRVRLYEGELRVKLRDGATGSYQIRLAASGHVLLTQDEITLAEAMFNGGGDWLRLNVTVIGSQIWVAVDEATLIAYTAEKPLPAGRAALTTGSTATRVDLDDVVIEGVVNLNDLTQAQTITTRDESGLNCELIDDYDWCAPIDFQVNFYGFTGSPRTDGVGYHGYPAGAESFGPYLRRYVSRGYKALPSGNWPIGRIVVLYDYTPGQSSGYYCGANRIELNSTATLSSSATFVGFTSLTSGIDSVATWTGTRNLQSGMSFYLQHGCRNQIGAYLPNPKGAMTIKKIVVYGYGTSPFGSNFPPTSTPTVTPTPTETLVPTVTASPTYAPSTSLEFAGQHSGLKAVIFWAIFNESSSDNFDSGSPIDDFILSSPRPTSFLFNLPYCSLGILPGDNAVESLFQTTIGDWYIRHCPHDYRYMAAQTILNGFLNYERRFGTNSIYEYAEQNFSGSIGNTSYPLWLISACQVNSYGTSYAAARSSSSQSTSYMNAIGWLTEYMTCLANLSTSDYTPTRVQQAFQTTIWPQVNVSVSDFYSWAVDPTDGAFSLLAANFGNGSLGTCVGGCTLQCTGSTIYMFEASPGTFVCFATPIDNISQSQVETAYSIHIQQISSYIPNYDSIAQPILRIHRNQSTGEIIGYIWHTVVYQRSLDMSHVPR